MRNFCLWFKYLVLFVVILRSHKLCSGEVRGPGGGGGQGCSLKQKKKEDGVEKSFSLNSYNCFLHHMSLRVIPACARANPPISLEFPKNSRQLQLIRQLGLESLAQPRLNPGSTSETQSVWDSLPFLERHTCDVTQLQVSDAHVALQQVIHFLCGLLFKLALLAEAEGKHGTVSGASERPTCHPAPGTFIF